MTTTRNPIKTILNCSKGIVHPHFLARKSLNDLLQQIKKCEVFSVSSIAFRKLISKHRPDLVILYFHEKEIRPDDLMALEEYVSNGGSILAIHSASASFKQEPTYHQLLGGRFINHGAICEYSVQPNQYVKEHFCMLNYEFTVKDELYNHEYASEVQVLLETKIDDKTEPVAWIKNHDQGKVAYFAPGHTPWVLRHPKIEAVIKQLIEWSFVNE